MVESRTLQLVLAAAQAQESTALFLSNSLKNKGYRSVTPSLLNFLSTLECGVNYGSEIARTLGVSRQMVAKIVKELCDADYLAQRDGLGKQKEIVFTEIGERLMSDARQLLADVDNILNIEVGQTQLEASVNCLTSIQKIMKQTQIK